MCTVTGGSITAPGGSPCPAGSTLQYQVNGGSWSATLPTYNTTWPGSKYQDSMFKVTTHDPMMGEINGSNYSSRNMYFHHLVSGPGW